MPFEFLSGIASSLISGLLTAGAVIFVRFLRQKRSEEAKLLAAEESSFQKILASDSIDLLGQYLDDKLGGFLISEYVSNKTVNHRVDSILSSIQDFLGRDEEIERELETPADLPPQEEIKPRDEFKIILEKFEGGVEWDALAAMRRFIELRLRKLAQDKDIKIRERTSAGYLVNILTKRGIIPKEMEQSLTYAIRVANNAIHGHDVPSSQAEEAIWIAQNAMQKLGSLEETAE